MLKTLKLLLTGIALTLLGVMAIALIFMIEDAKLPFWPFDGILAIAGGIYVTYWSSKTMSEP